MRKLVKILRKFAEEYSLRSMRSCHIIQPEVALFLRHSRRQAPPPLEKPILSHHEIPWTPPLPLKRRSVASAPERHRTPAASPGPRDAGTASAPWVELFGVVAPQLWCSAIVRENTAVFPEKKWPKTAGNPP
eukprot:scaffold106_cov246-Pinguiococcus_pyrenoidosus.AAC.25